MSSPEGLFEITELQRAQAADRLKSWVQDLVQAHRQRSDWENYVPQPEYTRSAKEARIQGEVVVRVNLTAQRRVEVLAIVGGLGYGLDQRGIEAARLVRFDPATVNGLPVDFTTNVHITYQLNGAN